MESLKHRNKVVGLKQSKNAVINGQAEALYIAEDADLYLTDSLRILAAENNISVIDVTTRKELAKACGIDVPTAVAALLK